MELDLMLMSHDFIKDKELWAKLKSNMTPMICVSLCVSWVAYEGAQFTENMYLLEKGEYPNTEAMGFLSSDTAVCSIQTVGHVSIVLLDAHSNLVGIEDSLFFADDK